MMEYQRQLGFDAALSPPSTKDNDKHLHKEVWGNIYYQENLVMYMGNKEVDFLFALSPLLINLEDTIALRR